MVVAGNAMTDHRLIQYRKEGVVTRFMPWHAREEHRADWRFVAAASAEPNSGPTVVVTHHLPSRRSVSAEFADSALNPAFASDLDDLVTRSGAALWVHGHTHTSCDYTLGATRVVCNPKGYGPARECPAENGEFNPSLINSI